METSVSNFGFNIYGKLSKESNVIFSPFSIFAALGMTLGGACNETLKSMISTMHWSKDDVKAYHGLMKKMLTQISSVQSSGANERNINDASIKVANRLFLEQKFQLSPSFTQIIDENYLGAVEKVNFQDSEKSRLRINAWVEEQTNSKIKDLINSGAINSLTRLILVNAIYFKASWVNKFDVIGPQLFTGLGGKSSQVEMMTRTKNCSYVHLPKSRLAAVNVDFQKDKSGNGYSLLIVLPDEKQGLAAVEANFPMTLLSGDEATSGFKFKNVHITMPKFRIDFPLKLKDVLSQLGMAQAFEDAADFSGMTGSRDLKIDDVIHKAFIQIDENGAEASAATAVTMMLRMAMIRKPEPPVEFFCDHPFFFVLLQNDALPLFVGRFLET